jgi:hypothetical protein
MDQETRIWHAARGGGGGAARAMKRRGRRRNSEWGKFFLGLVSGGSGRGRSSGPCTPRDGDYYGKSLLSRVRQNAAHVGRSVAVRWKRRDALMADIFCPRVIGICYDGPSCQRRLPCSYCVRTREA